MIDAQKTLKEENQGVLPVYLAKTVDLSKETIEALAESLSEKITEKLSSAIVDKFFQGAERLCIDEGSGVLGLILQTHLDEILKKQGEAQKEKERWERINRLRVVPDYGYPEVTYENRINVADENRRWEQQKRKEDAEWQKLE
jgi:hypothetical protein